MKLSLVYRSLNAVYEWQNLHLELCPFCRYLFYQSCSVLSLCIKIILHYHGSFLVVFFFSSTPDFQVPASEIQMANIPASPTDP